MSSSVYDFSSDGPGESEWESESDKSVDSTASVRTLGGSRVPVSGNPERIILSYLGYLKYPQCLTQSDLDRLRMCEELNDGAIDVLLAILHTDAVENGTIRENDVLVLPTAFQESFEQTQDLPIPSEVLARAHDRIKNYHETFWSSRLIIVPLQRGRYWFLAVVTNPYLARDQQAVPAPPQEPAGGDALPDQHPFGVILLNSWVSSSNIEFMLQCVKRYLSYSWNAIQGGRLQYVFSHHAKCLRQMDGVSCGLHLVRNAEIMMDVAAAEKVRKNAQGVRVLLQTEYSSLFRPDLAASDMQRSLRISSLEQHIQLYQSRGKQISAGHLYLQQELP